MSDESDDEARDPAAAMPLKRRQVLKAASAALSTLALGPVACSDESGDSGENGAGAMSGESGSGGAPSGGEAGSAGSDTGGGQQGSAGTGAGGSQSPMAGTDAAMPGSQDDSGAGPAPRDDAGSAPGDGRVTVAIVHRANVDDAVARAVELAGGLDAIGSGDSVFIKINGVSDRAIGSGAIRTSNEVIAAVVRLVKQRNPGRIVVGDRSARMFPDTEAVFRNAGITDAAMSAGADEVYAARSPTEDPDAWMLLQPPGYEGTWSAEGGILCMRRILESDHLINVPTCKNHRYALFSLSMKLFIGATGDDSRDRLHFNETLGADFTSIGRDIVILNQPFSPLMNILDATTALINGGPQGDGTDAVRTSPGLVFASRDRVALDAAAVSLIKLELSRTDVPRPDAAHPRLIAMSPFTFPQIVEAGSRGLGVSRADEVQLAFEDVADASDIEAIFRS